MESQIDLCNDIMALPINIMNLIENNTIESNRVEYKEGWNPEKILHTICAFANDYEDVGGGYIVIGVREADSQLNLVGLNKKDLTMIDDELLKVCNLIEPKYVAEMSIEIVDGKNVAVIWAVSDDRRPFKCPTNISSERKRDVEKAYYIRHGSHTVRASRDEELRLVELSRYISFDESTSRIGKVADIKRPLVEDYLHEVHSNLAGIVRSDQSLYETMRLVKGPPENMKPLNVALMMFSSEPDVFFPYAWVEIAIIHDVAGRMIDEVRFTGPVNQQIIKTLTFIKDRAIVERIRKIPDQAEALRYFNYPFSAIEEIVVNAIYHKSYEIPEPVKIYIYRNKIEITSLPGPDPSIPDDAIMRLEMKGKTYRNKRLGDYLKELRLTEGRNTGMAMIVDAMKKNGSEMPVYETDSSRSYLTVTIPIHPDFRECPTELMYSPRRRRTTDEIKIQILEILEKEGCLTASDVAKRVGYKGVTPVFRRCVNELIDSGQAEYLYPEHPTDSRQRICKPRNRIR